GHHAVAAAAQAGIADHVDHDPVHRQHREQHQGEEDHPGDEVELGNHVGEAHLLERSGIVCAGRGGGFLKHDAYLWMAWKKKDYWRNRTGVTAATARQFMLKSTGTRTRLATATPFSVAGLKRHFRAAWTAARSRSRLRLERSTSTSSTFPWASMLMTRITVPSIPARSALGG